MAQNALSFALHGSVSLRGQHNRPDLAIQTLTLGKLYPGVVLLVDRFNAQWLLMCSERLRRGSVLWLGRTGVRDVSSWL